MIIQLLNYHYLLSRIKS